MFQMKDDVKLILFCDDLVWTELPLQENYFAFAQ